jgi:hypothetical protein
MFKFKFASVPCLRTELTAIGCAVCHHAVQREITDRDVFEHSEASSDLSGTAKDNVVRVEFI